MPLQALAFTSRVADGISFDQVDDFVRDGASHNQLYGVTSILLYDGARFLQYIEGPEDGVSLVYSRVLNATSHRDLVELGKGSRPCRMFPYWPMRLIPVEAADLTACADSNWSEVFSTAAGAAVPGTIPLKAMAAVVAPHIN